MDTSATIDLCPSAAAPLPTLTDADAHLLPCRIDLNGVSDQRLYFTPETDAATGVKTAAFRGRELKGEALRCGGDGSRYDAYVVSSQTPSTKWTAEARVEGFTHWSRDADPASQTTGVTKLLHEWPEIAGCLAETVTQEEQEAALALMLKEEDEREARTKAKAAAATA